MAKLGKSQNWRVLAGKIQGKSSINGVRLVLHQSPVVTKTPHIILGSIPSALMVSFLYWGVGLTAKRSHWFFYHGNGTYKYQTKQESGFAIFRIVSSSRVYQQVPKFFGWSKTSILGSANPSKIDSSTTSTPMLGQFSMGKCGFCPTLAPFFSSGSHFSFDLFLAKSTS